MFIRFQGWTKGLCHRTKKIKDASVSTRGSCRCLGREPTSYLLVICSIQNGLKKESQVGKDSSRYRACFICAKNKLHFSIAPKKVLNLHFRAPARGNSFHCNPCYFAVSPKFLKDERTVSKLFPDLATIAVLAATTNVTSATLPALLKIHQRT